MLITIEKYSIMHVNTYVFMCSSIHWSLKWSQSIVLLPFVFTFSMSVHPISANNQGQMINNSGQKISLETIG